jgi:geranylgeranyl diphosphate synthase type I
MGNMDGHSGKLALKQYIENVKPLINEYLSVEVNKAEELGPITKKLMASFKGMASEGKGIRGLLISLAYQVCGGTDLDEIKKTSIFYELFHAGILVHDDFMDRDPLRRGRITIHEEFKKVGEEIGVKIPSSHYGNSLAVNIGDAVFYESWKVLISGKFPAERIIEAGKLYADYIVRLALGQVMDLTITGMEEITEEDALNVLLTKSVEYTSIVPLLIGATLAGEKDEKRMEAFKNYAKCFGWAFQIQDDVLGAFGKQEEFGKPVGSDFREGKNTLLILHLRKHGTNEQKDFMKKCLGNKDLSSEDAERLKQILIEAGSRKYVEDMGWNYVEEGKTYISDITGDPKFAEIFESLIVYMMERTK